jgi:hypothetical protein
MAVAGVVFGCDTVFSTMKTREVPLTVTIDPVTDLAPNRLSHGGPAGNGGRPHSEESVISLIKQFPAHRRALAFFCIAVGGVVLTTVHPLEFLGPTWSRVTEHLVVTLAVVSLVHLMDRFWLGKDIRVNAERIALGIRADIERTNAGVSSDIEAMKEEMDQQARELAEERKNLVQASLSLEAMSGSGILRLYSSRRQAAKEMRDDLVSPKASKIRLIGISLNDFVLAGNDTPLASAWSQIKERLLCEASKPEGEQTNLDVKVLIIDPECFGARQRDKAETGGESPRRLRHDVEEVSRSFMKLKRDLNSSSPSGAKVRFDCRLYRLPPMLFVCWTDAACFVQPYHFWNSRVQDGPVPTIRYRRIGEASEVVYNMHSQIETHFDWIWEEASVSLEDFWLRFSQGFDKAMAQTGAVNVFLDKDLALNRIETLLKEAKHTVDIQGISLHSFFGPAQRLSNLINSLIRKGDVDLKVLFIDRNCQQAKYRSFRENLLRDEDCTWEKYKSDAQAHERSDLFRHTQEAIENLRSVVRRARAGAAAGWRCCICAREYDTAPACFMLRVDDTVLYEPYHYGKIDPSGDVSRLGSDMPLFEFEARASALYDPVPDRSPFGLLKDSFSFAWNQAESKHVDFGKT